MLWRIGLGNGDSVWLHSGLVEIYPHLLSKQEVLSNLSIREASKKHNFYQNEERLELSNFLELLTVFFLLQSLTIVIHSHLLYSLHNNSNAGHALGCH